MKLTIKKFTLKNKFQEETHYESKKANNAVKINLNFQESYK